MTEQDQTPPQDEDTEGHGLRHGRTAARSGKDNDTMAHGRREGDDATDDDAEGHGFHHG
jgi:hypothetical protein